MIRNLFFLILGAFSGLWFIWPHIITTKGWECTKDVIASSNEDLTDIESLVESLPNRIKLGLAVSPKTLLKRENLTRIEKLRIVGDACFR
ncbi:Hypothetical protein NATL1_11331 [Prochlorococcus marinus str. NATL1A]|uniref:Uncharacterized protein n=1 Tax=Prochlorococcus marinus (strain NATL1A) TaxID=167555 RepID=A2C2I1_PROM1|nr:hypothetical protein [Prochlorococcus marinus]ABM75691.1 Hypothetical protein NATL1_11331 [Prochlorococcus marinus str. NATL1A]